MEKLSSLKKPLAGAIRFELQPQIRKICPSDLRFMYIELRLLPTPEVTVLQPIRNSALMLQTCKVVIQHLEGLIRKVLKFEQSKHLSRNQL